MLKTNRYTLVFGVGSTKLNAFDNALYNAGVGNYNLIKVSSVLSPISKEEIAIGGVDGGILSIAYGIKIENEKGTQIIETVGVGIPENSEKIGIIM